MPSAAMPAYHLTRRLSGSAPCSASQSSFAGARAHAAAVGLRGTHRPSGRRASARAHPAPPRAACTTR
eukprot:4388378-Prymnesium_polylepis.1